MPKNLKHELNEKNDKFKLNYTPPIHFDRLDEK